jgi:two-component system, cell cycle sensor histidine kinase and response regulator CckA
MVFSMRDSLFGRDGTLLQANPEAPRRGFDFIGAVAAALFVMAIAAAAYPAFKAGPTTGPGMLLLLGLAGVTFIGIFVFAAGEPKSVAERNAWGEVLDALPEPSAVLSKDGRILRANAAWFDAFGSTRRLPKTAEAGGLYTAMVAAKEGDTGRTQLSALDGEREALITGVAGRRFLVRAPQARPEPRAAVVEAKVEAPNVRPVEVAPAVAAFTASFDGFAAAAPFGAAALDGADPLEASILETNGALQTITGGKARPGVVFGDLLDPTSRADVAERLKAKAGGPVEVKLALDPPRPAHLYVARSEGGLLAYVVDVSEQKQLELQLAQSQKMQAIGQLAGGVAHDFNNLLTAIQLRLDELLHRHPVGDPSYEGLNEIRMTATRAADLVRKLLAFSRKQTVQRETLDVGTLMSEFEVLLKRILREDTKLETKYGRNLPLVRADKSQLETAVMNLAVNARDAMRSAGIAGTVTIRTDRCSSDECRTMGYRDAPAGEYAMIEVADSGPGIPQEIQDKIFEPFFTTKPVGEGTGLGLATVYGIVKQADGWIALDSAPGKGAAFRIFLPVYHPPARTEPVAPVEKKPAARDLSGAGRILFVEDEDAVRGVAARLLRARGYEVIEAADGEEALILAEEHAGQIDLLISDVIMPGLDGPTLLKKARGYLNGAPVMFISGYAEAEFSDLLEGETGVSFLPKPLDIKVLAERVKQQLQAA